MTLLIRNRMHSNKKPFLSNNYFLRRFIIVQARIIPESDETDICFAILIAYFCAALVAFVRAINMNNCI